MTIQELEKIIRKSWSKRIDNGPSELLKDGDISAGQCAVTALVVQDYLGGEILNTIATDSQYPDVSSSHYFNIINNEVVDLTKRQFKDTVQFSESSPKTKGFDSTRDYMLSFPSTVVRYQTLKSNVEKLLSTQ